MRSFALAAALVAAAFLPGERLGIAVVVVAGLMLLAAGADAPDRRPQPLS